MEGKKKRASLALVCVALLAILAVAGTVAYLQGTSGDVVNTFSTNEVTVDLKETTDDSYNIVPGTSETKDPKVTVKNTVDAYAYVKVDDKTEGLVTYAIADGWTALDTEKYPGVYYREVAADETTKSFSVLAGDKVSYASSLTNEDMKKLKDSGTLTFTAYAIQKEPFDDPVLAYKMENATTVDSDDGLKEALAKGESVVLSGDVAIPNDNTDAESEYNMAERSVLDLGGNTMTIPFMKGIFQGEDAKIMNGTIESDANYPLFIGNGSKETSITVENVTLNGGINVYAGEATLSDVTADASSKAYYAVWADNGATITIESGTYVGGVNNGTQQPAVNSSENGSVIIKGGKFNTDISKYVATGYKVVQTESDGTTWYEVVASE